MKPILIGILAFLLFLLPVQAQKNRMLPGGDTWQLAGTVTIMSAGILDIASGGYLKIAGVTVSATAAQLNYLNGITPGTVTASKAVVVDGSKDISAFGNVTAVNYDAGASGTAGSVDIFPATASKGKIAITATNNSGNTTTSITNAAQAAARVYTIPDAGADASFMMTAGVQEASGAQTFSGGVDIGKSGTIGSLDIFPTTASKGKFAFSITDNAGNTTTTFTVGAQAAARNYTLPDAGADANLMLTAGAQEATGAQTFSGGLDIGKSGTAGSLDIFPTTASKGKFAFSITDNAGDTTTTFTIAAQAAARNYTLPDAGGDASLVLTAGNQEVSGTKTFLAAIESGKSGTIGGINIYPTTASKGKLAISATDSAGNTTTTVTNASQAAARSYTIPDAGADADFVMNAGNQTIAGTKTFSSDIKTSSGIGVAGTGVVAAEYGGGVIHKTVLTLTLTGANDIDLADGDHGIGVKLYDMPEGYIQVVGVLIDLQVVTNNVYNASPNDIYYIGIGSATAGDDNTLAGTEQDIIAVITNDTAASTVLTHQNHAQLTALTAWDGTATPIDIFCNVAIATGSQSGATTYAVTGTVTITWVNLGDY